MVPKALLHSSVCIVLSLAMLACNDKKVEAPAITIGAVDVSHIPVIAMMKGDTSLLFTNGIYYCKGKPYSGFIKDTYENGSVKSNESYYLGKLHGTCRTYYDDGKLRDERNYKEGLSYGRHLGYWENGHRKFAYSYCNEKKEGPQLRWYESGKPYMALNYKDDREDGLQKAWRENGKLFINYEVRNGLKYGLQSSALCYTLKDGSLIAK